MARIEADVMLERRYRLIRWIRTGVLGEVWEGEDHPHPRRNEEQIWHTQETIDNDRRVAIEIITDPRAEDPAWFARFRRGVLPALARLLRLVGGG